MEADLFDRITRSLGRRMLLPLPLFRPTDDPDGGGRPGMVEICHDAGDVYRRIVVHESTVQMHIGHGDFLWIDCCNDDECPALATCNRGVCVHDIECFTNDACASNEICSSGKCRTLACPPHLTAIDHRCQHPCSDWHAHCSDPDAGAEAYNCNCMSQVSGEAICLKHSSVFDGGLGYCTSDEHCQSLGPPEYVWQCLRNPIWDEGGLCYGDVTFCEGEWNVLPG